MTQAPLSTTDHNRTIAGLTYIYPVMSRRAGGLSIGINLNINNACNWRCIYCQVPQLKIGSAPQLNKALLAKELRFFLHQVIEGNFYDEYQVPLNQRVIKDIAISGNGEPTSLKNFAEAVQLIGDIGVELKVLPTSRYIVISNGSLIHLPQVQSALQLLNNYGGEVWFKLDNITDSGRKQMNNAAQSGTAALDNLLLAATLCKTKIQTCLLDYDNQGIDNTEREALLKALAFIKASSSINEVMLYTIARQSHQPEAIKIKPLSVELMNDFAEQVRALGFCVSVNI
jgi:wyosine [tRNA(Phe)-imidazoG37] synthetase (radical SAM superfamily)